MQHQTRIVIANTPPQTDAFFILPETVRLPQHNSILKSNQ